MKMLGRKKQLDELYKIFEGNLNYTGWEKVLKWLHKNCEWQDKSDYSIITKSKKKKI